MGPQVGISALVRVGRQLGAPLCSCTCEGTAWSQTPRLQHCGKEVSVAMATQQRVLCYSSRLVLYPAVPKLTDLRIPLNS